MAVNLKVPALYFCLFLFGLLLNYSSQAQNHQIDSLIKVVRIEKDSNVVLPLMRLITGVADDDSCLNYWKVVLELSESMSYYNGQLQSLYKISDFQQIGNEHEEAIRTLDRILPVAEKAGFKKFEYLVFRNKARSLQKLGRSKDALESLLTASKVADELNKQDLQAEILFEMGDFHRLQHNYEKSISYFEKASTIYRENDLESGYCRLLFYMAITYKHFDEIDLKRKGIASLIEVIEGTCGTKLSDFKQAINWSNLGSAYIDIDELEKGEEALLHALNLKRKIGDPVSIAYTLNELSSLYLKKKNAPRALKYAEEAYSNGSKGEDVFLMEDVLENLAISNYQSGNYQNGYEFLYRYKELKDSIRNKDTNQALAEMSSKFELEKKEKDLMQKDLLIARQESRFNQYLLIGLGILALILGLFFWSRWTLQKQKLNAQKLRELDELKSNFFTNITHEFRTPLTVILNGLANKKIDENRVSLSQNEADIIQRNADRLQNLINQLLDLSKLEAGKAKLIVSQNDLVAFLKRLAHSFESIAGQKEIRLQFFSPIDEIKAYFDVDKVEKIVSNLLANAIKFTPNGGEVNLLLLKNEEDNVEIIVKDNGIGIAEAAQKHIFDRFHQVDYSDTRSYEGSGIGLALVDQMVKIHGGQITVDSRLGKGSIFTVQLPVNEKNYTKEQIAADLPFMKIDQLKRPLIHPSFTLDDEAYTNSPEDKEQAFILLVEDDADLRFLLKTQLSPEYKVVEAVNGEEGLEIALHQIPDLIISDVMMPEMSGYELCKRLKTEERTSHIPIILLTAKATQGEKLEGLESGADSYLVKPFDKKELETRIRQLILQRKKLQQRFSREIVYRTKETSVASRQDIFIRNLLENIEEEIANDGFGVEELAQSVHMSRSQLYRKVKALTGKTPNVFLREIRLGKAKELLEQNAGNVSEIANMVGFSNANYFYKCFKDAFGITPGEVLRSES